VAAYRAVYEYVVRKVSGYGMRRVAKHTITTNH
jgi:hypothetical protein